MEKTKLTSILGSVRDKWNLEEEFQTFLKNHNMIPDLKPDVGFLLFLIEQQRMAVNNLTDRVEVLEAEKKRRYEYQPPVEHLKINIHKVSPEELLNG